MWKNKINAFTLMEVTIAMVLAAISIAISFTVYQLLNKAYQQFDTKNKVAAEFMMLDQLLKKDISAADQVIHDEGHLVCRKAEQQIIYSFEEEFMTRNHDNIRVDSFFIANRSVQFYFENLPTEDSKVDCLEFEAEFNGKYMPVKYQKDYSAQALMESGLIE